MSDLLSSRRPAPPAFRTVGVLDLVRETAAVAAGDPLAARVRFDVEGADAEVSVDPGQMGRALLNLMTNAAQAMRHGGVVRVVGERLAGS